ncbi:MAG: DUF1259 domain-containing protein [Vicinamibacterales bacterium]
MWMLSRAAFAAALLSITALASAQAPTPGRLDIAAIDRAIGRAGQNQAGDVYRVSFPRSDLDVSVGNVKVRPGLALGSWAAFKSTGAAAIAHGDLVLTDAEINPVISALQEHGFEITALHNHLANASRSVMYLHFWGHGTATELASAVRDALTHTRTPLGPLSPPAPVAAPDFPSDQFQAVIGLRGAVNGGVLGLAQPRPETIQMMGVTLPPSMGMSTAINVQAAGEGRVAATGDFVMLADEVNPVAKALRQHGIAITALHNHMLHGSPELYFMHFWAEGDASTVATGLKAALDLLKH